MSAKNTTNIEVLKPAAPLSLEFLGVLQEILGVDQYGRGHHKRYIVCVKDCSRRHVVCDELAKLGLLHDVGRIPAFGDQQSYAITDDGIRAVDNQSPKPPKPKHQGLSFIYLVDNITSLNER